MSLILRGSCLWMLGIALLAGMPLLLVEGADKSASSVTSVDTDADMFVRLVAEMRSAVVAVGIYNAKGTPTVVYAGTGFVVADGQSVVTNAHVVEAMRKNIEQLRVFFPDPPQQASGIPDARPVEGRKATVVVEDRVHDLALLRFEGRPVAALSLSAVEPPQGRSVGIIGYPIGMALGLVPAVHKGVVAAVVPAVLPLPKGAPTNPLLLETLRDPYNIYQLDLLVFPGNSGSPLFDAHNGKVIGIINKTLATQTREHLLDKPSGVAYAIPARWIQALLRKAAVARAEEASGMENVTGAGIK